MTCAISYTGRARRDVDDIFHWLVDHSPEGAARWYDRLCEAINSLADGGETHGVAAETVEFDQPIRQVLFKTRKGRTYRAIFITRLGQVHVLAVRGPGQRPLTCDELTARLRESTDE